MEGGEHVCNGAHWNHQSKRSACGISPLENNAARHSNSDHSWRTQEVKGSIGHSHAISIADHFLQEIISNPQSNEIACEIVRRLRKEVGYAEVVNLSLEMKHNANLFYLLKITEELNKIPYDVGCQNQSLK